MSKIVAILLIILIIHLKPFIPEAKAAVACSSNAVGVIYGNPKNGTTNENTFFQENSGSLTIEFAIDDSNILNSKEVFLHLPGGLFGRDDKNTYSTIATSPKFQLIIDQSFGQAGKGKHDGSLYWPDPNKSGEWQELCSIKYQVGTATAACSIQQTLPSEIPPNSQLTIVFLGAANQEYELRKNNDVLAKITTDNTGLGTFNNVVITGNVADQFRLTLGTTTQRYACQTQEITITSTAPPPPIINPPGPIVPVPIAPGTQGCNPKINPKCTSGGGKDIPGCNIPIDPNNPNDPAVTNPGIATAIGCIHTNPAEFVKDLLTFLLGIGGGLAFLMMLLGAFQMLTSAGNPETLNAGKERLTSAIIGLLFIIFTILLLQIIGVGILNLPGFKP